MLPKSNLANKITCSSANSTRSSSYTSSTLFQLDKSNLIVEGQDEGPTDVVNSSNAPRVVKFEFNRQANSALRPGVQFTLTAFLPPITSTQEW